jgi:hypothetical protein
MGSPSYIIEKKFSEGQKGDDITPFDGTPLPLVLITSYCVGTSTVVSFNINIGLNATKIEPSENCDDDTGVFFPSLLNERISAIFQDAGRVILYYLPIE